MMSLTLEVVVLLKGKKTAFHFILKGWPADGLWHQVLHDGGAEQVHGAMESADAPVKPLHDLLHAFAASQPPQHAHQFGVGADCAASNLEAHHFTQLLQTHWGNHCMILTLYHTHVYEYMPSQQRSSHWCVMSYDAWLTLHFSSKRKKKCISIFR